MKKLALIFVVLLLCSALAYNFYPVEKLPAGIVVDSIVVHKSQRQLMVFAHGKLLHTYKVALGKHPVGAKEYEGDGKTPEGRYYINTKNPQSRYHKNLGVSYPGETDRANAIRSGKLTGGDIKIHGVQNNLGYIRRLQSLRDWTAGCIALSNAEIDDLYEHVPIGTTIDIRP